MGSLPHKFSERGAPHTYSLKDSGERRPLLIEFRERRFPGHRILGRGYPSPMGSRERGVPCSCNIRVEMSLAHRISGKGRPAHRTKERGAPCLWNMVSLSHRITVMGCPSPIEFQEQGANGLAPPAWRLQLGASGLAPPV